ncbi:unnamed protein product [Brugia timori]|uniref:I-set domain-containing protein n=1 Tax=Brugia timori TaxID=42155 RepID=A0A0R3QBE3_9BILA|nr:unnamed protein product [Brugia timori]
MKVSDSEYRLELSKVSPDDHGIYQIDFRHGGKTFTSAASLVVLDKQNERAVCKLPQSVTVKSSTPCKLVLEMENGEDWTVQWFKGLSKVEKSNRIKSVKSGNAFKLDFKDVQPDDEGIYVVKVIKDKKAICKYAAALLKVLIRCSVQSKPQFLAVILELREENFELLVLEKSLEFLKGLQMPLQAVIPHKSHTLLGNNIPILANDIRIVLNSGNRPKRKFF